MSLSSATISTSASCLLYFSGPSTLPVLIFSYLHIHPKGPISSPVAAGGCQVILHFPLETWTVNPFSCLYLPLPYMQRSLCRYCYCCLVNWHAIMKSSDVMVGFIYFSTEDPYLDLYALDRSDSQGGGSDSGVSVSEVPKTKRIIHEVIVWTASFSASREVLNLHGNSLLTVAAIGSSNWQQFACLWRCQDFHCFFKV